MDQEQPLVSIIMPCYNHEKYVGEAIESILKQTYKTIQFIITDNGSTDNSYDVIKKYADKIDIILHLDENDPGQAEALMVSRAKGKYIALMTSDDVWKEDKIMKQVKILEENSNIQACFTWADIVDETLNIVKDSPENIFKVKNRTRYEWLEQLLIGGNCLACPSVLMNREMYMKKLEQLQPFCQLRDLQLWINFLLDSDIYIIQEVLCYFRKHPNGYNRNMSAINLESKNRTYTELTIVWENVIDQIDRDTFINTFHNYFQDPLANTDRKIMCEKFFLLMKLGKVQPVYEQLAINYYYKTSYLLKERGFKFANILKEEYNYNWMSFHEYCANYGTGSLYNKLETLSRDLKSEQTKNQDDLSKYRAMMKEILDDNKKKSIYRKYFWDKLQDGEKEIVQLINIYLDKIKICTCYGNIRNNPKFIQSVQEINEPLQIIWHKLLKYDIEADVDKWNSFCTVVQSNFIVNDSTEQIFISFFENLQSILRHYIENINYTDL